MPRCNPRAVHALEHSPLFIRGDLVLDTNLRSRSGARTSLSGKDALCLRVDSTLALLGFTLYAAPHVLYEHYTIVNNPLGLSPIEDQHLGGLIMWSAGGLVLFVAMLATIVAWRRLDLMKAAALPQES